MPKCPSPACSPAPSWAELRKRCYICWRWALLVFLWLSGQRKLRSFPWTTPCGRAYRHPLELLWVSFQATKVKQILQ